MRVERAATVVNFMVYFVDDEEMRVYSKWVLFDVQGQPYVSYM